MFVETCRVGEALERLACVAGERKCRQAAIVHDWNNMWAIEESQGPRNAGMGYWEEMLRHYRGLSKNGVSVEFVNQDSDLAGYKLVICPMLYMLREEFAQKLRAFTEAGGTLVVTYWSGIVDETDLCYLGDTPHNLTDVLGLRRLEIDGMYDGETRSCVSMGGVLPEKAEAGVLCEVALCETASPLMLYAEDFYIGAPTVSVNYFGKGKAYYVASRFEKEFYTPLYKEICRNLIAPAWEGELPEGVMTAARGEFVFLQNSLDAPVHMEDLELEPYGTAVYRVRGGKRERVL